MVRRARRQRKTSKQSPFRTASPGRSSRPWRAPPPLTAIAIPTDPATPAADENRRGTTSGRTTSGGRSGPHPWPRTAPEVEKRSRPGRGFSKAACSSKEASLLRRLPVFSFVFRLRFRRRNRPERLLIIHRVGDREALPQQALGRLQARDAAGSHLDASSPCQAIPVSHRGDALSAPAGGGPAPAGCEAALGVDAPPPLELPAAVAEYGSQSHAESHAARLGPGLEQAQHLDAGFEGSGRCLRRAERALRAFPR